jgi:Ca2+/Na+ antiporter
VIGGLDWVEDHWEMSKAKLWRIVCGVCVGHTLIDLLMLVGVAILMRGCV